jgi:hypothetical protein
MKSRKLIVTIMVAAMASVFSIVGLAGTAVSQESDMDSTVVRDSSTVLLAGKGMTPKDYIHLYDTTPYMIMNGHVAAKIPCDENSEPQVQILVGQAPDLKEAELELISELSKPGKLCLYHADIESVHEEEDGIITDIAIYNPQNTRMVFPATSSVVIGVNEIMPGAEEHHE